MKPETIKAIFTNLIFVIGIILTVVGLIRSTSTLAKIVVFGEYPLPSYEETRCAYQPIVPLENGAEDKITDYQLQERDCNQKLQKDRKLRMVDDIVVSVSLLASGLVLCYSFRRFIFK